MRKRSIKLGKEWNLKILRTCWESIRQNNDSDKKFMRKLMQVTKRVMNLDMAKAF